MYHCEDPQVCISVRTIRCVSVRRLLHHALAATHICIKLFSKRFSIKSVHCIKPMLCRNNFYLAKLLGHPALFLCVWPQSMALHSLLRDPFHRRWPPTSNFLDHHNLHRPPLNPRYLVLFSYLTFSETTISFVVTSSVRYICICLSKAHMGIPSAKFYTITLPSTHLDGTKWVVLVHVLRTPTYE